MTRTLAATAAVVVFAGCSDPTGRQPVRGTVTLGGAPLAAGTIRFETEPGVSPSCIEGAAVRGGHYDLPAHTGLRPGRYRVVVSATDGVPAPPEDVPPGLPSPPARELVPARYNTKTTLTADVVPGRNTLDFALDR